MRKLLPLVALAAAMAGCARSDNPDVVRHAAAKPAIAPRASRLPAAGLAAVRARVVRGERYAALPDRGELLAYAPGAPEFRSRAYTWKQVRLSELHALGAIGGTMTIEAPDGHVIRLRYDRHIEHSNGDWTWIGRPAGAQPGTEALITFGEKAVFGSIPDGKGAPLRLMQANGASWMVQTDSAALATIPGAHPTVTDAFPVPRAAQRPVADGASRTSASAPTSATAAAAASTTVDLVLGYTTSFASRLGGQSQANTRLNNMVDFANQAYQNSGIDARVRLVNAVQVDYADNTDNDQALYDLTGYDCSGSGSCVRRTVPASLQPLRNARDQYGADVMSLVRNFDDDANGSCGVGWILGGGQSPIDSSDAAWAVSVVSDSNGRGPGSFPSNGYVCRDETLAHEMGHNMGAQHDVATAKGDNNVLDSDEYGRFPYSFGYKTDANNGNFYTVMAYGDTGQTPYRVFSNPRITFCGGYACGTGQADNALTLGQTTQVIATFRATVVPTPGPPTLPPAPYDVNADGRSDILFAGGSALAYWGMNGAGRLTDAYLGDAGPGWRFVAFGNFDAAGGVDVLWTNGSQIRIWFNTGLASYVVYPIASYSAGWEPFAASDVNGDGKSDILFRSGTAIAYWLMDSTSVVGNAYAGDGGSGYRVVTTGDFTGDGADEIVWANASSIKMWVNGKSAGYTPAIVGSYATGWVPFASGDVNGDGRRDLLLRGGTALAYWQLNGAAVVSSAYLGDGGSGYKPFAVGDYNMDGAADIGWHNGANIKLWMNNGAGGYAPAQVGAFNCCWAPEGGLQ